MLSACESGLGQATASEGLLGSGRALLQAGAATAILTLWKVDDLMTSRFGAAPVTCDCNTDRNLDCVLWCRSPLLFEVSTILGAH